jgi:hypothetical protein
MQVDQTRQRHERPEVGRGRGDLGARRSRAGEGDPSRAVDLDQAVGLVERSAGTEWGQETGADGERRPRGKRVSQGVSRVRIAGAAPALGHERGC